MLKSVGISKYQSASSTHEASPRSYDALWNTSKSVNYHTTLVLLISSVLAIRFVELMDQD